MAEGDPARVNSRAVLEAAALRDPLAREVVEQFASDLGLGLSNLLHIFNPEIVILGGGVSQSLHLFFPLLKAAVRRHAMAHIKDRIPLVASILGDDAALLGAAHLAFQRGGHG
jgi:glucokinase